STGAGKVNLIGHSEGGLDARYVLAVRPDLIASLTTVATPHLGADLADFFADNIADGGFNSTVLAAFGNSLGTVIDLLTGPAATRCGAPPITTAGIPLFSWAGSSKLTNLLDVSDPALGLASLFYSEAN